MRKTAYHFFLGDDDLDELYILFLLIEEGELYNF